MKRRIALALGALAALWGAYLLLRGGPEPELELDSGQAESPRSMQAGSGVPGTSAPVGRAAEPLPGAGIEETSSRHATVDGSVLDSSGQPVEGATVRLLAGDSMRELGMEWTEPAGAFTFAELELGTYRIYVHTGRHRPRWQGPIRLTRPGEVLRLLVMLEDGRVLAGRVTDAEGHPIASAHVGSSDDGSAIAITDPEGRFELGGLGESNVHVFATARGYGPKHLRGLLPDASPIEIVLSPASSLVGTVALAEGTRAMTVSLCHHDPWFQKELCVARQHQEPPEKSFALDELPAGEYELVIEAEGHAASRTPLRLSPGRTLTLPAIRPTPE